MFCKLNDDGTLHSANVKTDESFLSLDLFTKDKNDNYYKYYNQDGTADIGKIEKEQLEADKQAHKANWKLQRQEEAEALEHQEYLADNHSVPIPT